MICSACASMSRALCFCLMYFGEDMEKLPSTRWCMRFIPVRALEVLSFPWVEGEKGGLFKQPMRKATFPSDY